MSSPRSIGGSVREGTRVVLREITASLHNSSPMQLTRRKSGADNSASKSTEHEVKVRFAREFADVGSIIYSAPESLSSASSFQSLTSTLSTKSSSGICPDSVPPSPNQPLNNSYANTNISGVDDLILGCSEINLNSDDERSFNTLQNSQDLSQDQTFASATDEPADLTRDLTRDISLTEAQNTGEVVGSISTTNDSSSSLANRTQDIEERPVLRTICTREPPPTVIAASDRRNSFIKLEGLERPSSPNKSNELNSSDIQTNDSSFLDGVVDVLPQCHSTEGSTLNTTVCLSPNAEVAHISKEEEPSILRNVTSEARSLSLSLIPSSTANSITRSESLFEEHAEVPSLPSIPNFSSLLNTTDSNQLGESDAQEDRDNEKILERSSSSVNNSNAAVIACSQITEQSPVVELQDKSVSVQSSIVEPQNTSASLHSPAVEAQTKSTGLLSPAPEQDKSARLRSPTPEARDRNGRLRSVTPEPPNKSVTLANLASSSLCNDAPSSEHILLSNSPVARPKTPEVQEKPAGNICQEAANSNIVVSNVELPPPTENNIETSISPAKKEAEKSDESPSKKDVADLEQTGVVSSIGIEENEVLEEQCSEEQLDTTLTLQDASLTSGTVPEEEQYTEFKPLRQSTTLATLNVEQPNVEEQYTEFKQQRQSTSFDTLNIQPPNFDELKSAAEQVANDIFNSSLEFSEEPDNFISATSEIFQDPTSFDFLINHGNSKTINRLRAESLYVKFDPLVGDSSMLPQGNTPPISEEQNGKSENIPADIETPKRNPAIAAIDRLLFYSPLSTSMTQKTDEPQEKTASKEPPVEEPKSVTPLITDVNMSKELELVRATVLQLEEELEKQKKEYEAEVEKQKEAFQEKMTKLQAQMAQEVKSKSQMTVVVEEYEKSISRLLTERERDRTNFEQEKAKLQEELQTTNVHLANTEAAFNDVHQKYERLKGVVSAHKSNETLLKESIQENMETIKGLEARYEQLKNHAMSQLEKANYELDAMRKQHEDETVKLHAMVRKAELKSNSLAELVEQKTKENKELTQILDEVIARVGHQNAE